AFKELKSYVHDYPNAKESDKIRKLLADVVARLMRHELYVARFYLHKDNYEAAVARITYALRTYGEADSAVVTSADPGLKAEALLLLGTTYLKMEKWGDARQAFEAIVRGYAQSPLATEARNYLTFLRQKGV
ncbi:MAG: outer membrane protein assembly factor BamD, partial [Polyangiaceae bacterium]